MPADGYRSFSLRIVIITFTAHWSHPTYRRAANKFHGFDSSRRYIRAFAMRSNTIGTPDYSCSNSRPGSSTRKSSSTRKGESLMQVHNPRDKKFGVIKGVRFSVKRCS